MSEFPSTTVKVTSIEPCGKAKVCITMQLVVDVNRMAEVSSQLLRASIGQMKDQDAARKKK